MLKSITYAYPTSAEAKLYGYYSNGCFVVGLAGEVKATNDPLEALELFDGSDLNICSNSFFGSNDHFTLKERRTVIKNSRLG